MFSLPGKIVFTGELKCFHYYELYFQTTLYIDRQYYMLSSARNMFPLMRKIVLQVKMCFH